MFGKGKRIDHSFIRMLFYTDVPWFLDHILLLIYLINVGYWLFGVCYRMEISSSG